MHTELSRLLDLHHSVYNHARLHSKSQHPEFKMSPANWLSSFALMSQSRTSS